MMKRTMLGALAVAAGAAWAVEPGDVLSFAGGGGLHRVAVTTALSETSFAGTMDGYAGTLNATVVVTEDGWILNADDWKAGCSWNVVQDASGQRVACQAKPRHGRHVCWKPTRAVASEAAEALGQRKVVAGWTDGWAADPVANEVDILIVYDRTGLAWLSSTGRTPKAYAEAQIAKMNLALANSGLAGEFAVRLCGVLESEVDVTRDCGRKQSAYLEEGLQRMVGSTGAKWKAIRDAREKTGADLVMMLADSDPGAKSVDEIGGTIGISASLENDSEKGLFGLDKAALDEHRDQAYGACNIRYVDADNTFSHEVGHVLGAGHSELLSEDYSRPGPLLFPYSCAKMYLDVDGEYYFTIMGYNSTDGEDDSPTYKEIPYFSSPELAHPETGTALGDDRHDNVRTLRETYAIVSQFRVNASRRPTPVGPSEEWKKARTLAGVVAVDGAPTGVVQLKVGRMNARSGAVRVSGSITGRDGKKYTLVSGSAPVRDDAVSVILSVRNREEALVAKISAKGIESLTFGEAVYETSSTAGGALANATPSVTVDASGAAELATAIEGLQADLLPTEEAFAATATRWTFKKAALVKLVRNRTTGAYELDVNTTRDRTNLSGLKLTYAARTGLFKGSFKAYAVVESRGRPQLKKYTVRVSGFVANGKGYGQAVLTRPAAGPISVTIE